MGFLNCDWQQLSKIRVLLCALRGLLALLLDRSHMCKGHMLKALLNC